MTYEQIAVLKELRDYFTFKAPVDTHALRVSILAALDHAIALYTAIESAGEKTFDDFVYETAALKPNDDPSVVCRMRAAWDDGKAAAITALAASEAKVVKLMEIIKRLLDARSGTATEVMYAIQEARAALKEAGHE